MAATSAARGERTRARLLDAAVRLIVEQGWGEVTTRRVAARAGVPQGTVHYHFATVGDLRIEAALDALARARVTVDGADPSTAVLLTETLLAATREDRLRGELSALMRQWHAGEEDVVTAAVLAATLHSLVLHRLVDPGTPATPPQGALRRLARPDAGGGSAGG
ncbi:TetR/AcrR family transcriptional regulator [Streptomyces sp. 891-h]|uniref:TetR/AcrR family transcriptional regulator n=1 Tax=Streptomyces sp. 891-h TaxID=2720714 RepID=UPI001FAAA7DF|nr:TetR/AcrR family transcriptional regulator [Streptomyces sp. 891-h]UNZ20723.1 TetR/AcrR family transcriptional regulator [Streptomyces sp. 891-h]